MIIPVEITDYDRKISLPFIIQTMGILSDVISTYVASLYGIPEANINANPIMEFIVVTIVMSLGMVTYHNIKNEWFYKGIIIISFITFIPAIYNLYILTYLASFPF